MHSLNHYLSHLNEAQHEVVRYGSGPTLVVAGPGSGKTRVLTVRIARMLRDGVCDPVEVTALTFTRKAAHEMRERLQEMSPFGKEAHVQTFHAMCNRILRREIDFVDGFTSEFGLCATSGSEKLVKEILEDMEIKLNHLEVYGLIDQWKRNDLRPEAFQGRDLDEGRDWLSDQNWWWDSKLLPEDKRAFLTNAGKVYAEYQARLLKKNWMDFNDTLMKVGDLLHSEQEVLDRCRAEARQLLVDEYQDTDALQYRIVLALAQHGEQNICAVGDPDQSIYAFRGADIRNLLRFKDDFPGCRMIRLDENYRSTRSILSASNEVIRNNKKRVEKEMRSNVDYDEKICVFHAETFDREIVKCAKLAKLDLARKHPDYDRNFMPSDILVLARTGRALVEAEKAFIDQDIPCHRVTNRGFYEHKEILDILAYLKLIQDPTHERSFCRILNQPTRGIGPATVRRLEDQRRGSETLVDISRLAPMSGAFAHQQVRVLNRFWELIDGIRSMPDDTPLGVFFDEILSRTTYRQMLEKKKDQGLGVAPLERLSHIRELLVETKAPDWSTAIETLMFEIDMDTAEEPNIDRARLMTIHSSKGLEAPIVFVLGMVEGILPHIYSMEDTDGIEEERRLTFVAMTRAMRRLYLGYHDSKVRNDCVEPTAWSRFLPEISIDTLRMVGIGKESVESKFLNKKVRHHVYGVGVVGKEELDADGDLRVRVYFEGYGTKTMMASSLRLD